MTILKIWRTIGIMKNLIIKLLLTRAMVVVTITIRRHRILL